MSLRPLSCSAILLPLTAAFLAAQQSAAPADLDATVTRVMAEQHVVGASVLVAKDGRVLLAQGLRPRRSRTRGRRRKTRRSTTSSARCCRSRASP